MFEIDERNFSLKAKKHFSQEEGIARSYLSGLLPTTTGDPVMDISALAKYTVYDIDNNRIGFSEIYE